MFLYPVVLAASFSISYAASLIFSRGAPAVAQPDPFVATHTAPTPLLGGVGIMAGLLPALAIVTRGDSSSSWWWYAAGAAVVSVLGVYKDVVQRPVSPAVQLAVQAAAVALALTGSAHAGALAIAVTLLAVNGWNMLDVMDGLAGGVGLVAASFLALIAARLGHGDVAILSVALAGSLGGFLVLNRHPARIFMGDVGSFNLGLFFGATIARCRTAAPDAGFLPLLLIIAVPLAELGFTSISRLAAGRSPLRGDGAHLSLRLLGRGWPVPRIVGCHCLAAAAAASLALALL